MADMSAVNRLLNQEIKCAQDAGLTVLYCIGETSEEQPQWEQVLGEQLDVGLDGVDKSRVVIGYEPVWSIGPGKTRRERTTSPRSPASSRSAPGGWMWSTAAA